MSEITDQSDFFDSNLFCDECLLKECTLLTLNLERKLCEDCANQLRVETTSITVLYKTKTPEQYENYQTQINGYETLCALLDTKLSEYDVALNDLESLYEERRGWIMDYDKENQEFFETCFQKFLRDRDELLGSVKNQLTSDQIVPYSLEITAYTKYQDILGASIISCNHDENSELINYVSNTMKFEWSPPDIFSTDKHRIEFISTRSKPNEILIIDPVNKISYKKCIITNSIWTKGMSWCKHDDHKIFICGGKEKGLWDEYPSSISGVVYLQYITSDEQPKMGKKKSFPTLDFYNLHKMNYNRVYHSVVFFDDDVYVIGGIADHKSFKMIEKFNKDTNKWQNVFVNFEKLVTLEKQEPANQKASESQETLERIGPTSTCKIDDGILIAGELYPYIYFFDPKINHLKEEACLEEGAKILLKSNDAIYCLVGRSLYKSDLKHIDFMLVKDDIGYKENWWMPSQEICVGTKIFFITEKNGVGELWELDVSTSDYALRKLDFRIN